MKLAVICFTGNGRKLCRTLMRGFQHLNMECRGYEKTKSRDECLEEVRLSVVQEPLTEWAKARFRDSDGLIFVGAAGIAVRAIAPCLLDKKQDPAVIVVDEQGRFSVSLLSGHVGGANQLAKEAARILGAVPVITTATDLREKFAVDLFAKENHLWLSDWQLAKEISAAVLEGETIGFFNDFKEHGERPEELNREDNGRYGIWVTAQDTNTQKNKVLRLVPQVIYIGIGCRKGTSRNQLEQAVQTALDGAGLCLESLAGIASIDLKKQEPGLLELAQCWRLPFLTYSADQLKEVPGEFIDSSFVAGVTGVGNVCERAAVLAAGGDRSSLVRKKQAADGVTVALAQRDYQIRWDKT